MPIATLISNFSKTHSFSQRVLATWNPGEIPNYTVSHRQSELILCVTKKWTLARTSIAIITKSFHWSNITCTVRYRSSVAHELTSREKNSPQKSILLLNSGFILLQRLASWRGSRRKIFYINSKPLYTYSRIMFRTRNNYLIRATLLAPPLSLNFSSPFLLLSNESDERGHGNVITSDNKLSTLVYNTEWDNQQANNISNIFLLP